ncbi:hypothetical protein GCM10028812_05380 [Ancylobacter sonchi]
MSLEAEAGDALSAGQFRRDPAIGRDLTVMFSIPEREPRDLGRKGAGLKIKTLNRKVRSTCAPRGIGTIEPPLER